MRHTRAHTGNRRSHHALKSTNFTSCTNCNEPRKTHTVCTNCGFYRGRQVIDVARKAKKKVAKAEKKKA